MVTLDEGKRVFVQHAHGGAELALIERRHGNTLELELLDPWPDTEAEASPVVSLRVVDQLGVHTWPAAGPSGPSGGRLTVSLGGPPAVLQRRRHPRYSVDLVATVHRLDSTSHEGPLKVQIVDLSEGGLRMVGGDCAIGDTVLVTVELDGEPVELVGRVLLAYPDGRGARIAHVAFLVPAGPSEPSQLLAGYLNRLARQALVLSLV